MNIFLVGSKTAYGKVPEVKAVLERAGHVVTVPNGYDNPSKEAELKKLSTEEFQSWKREMLKRDKEIIRANDAVLVLNVDKGDLKNYIGGATFLEIYNAFDLGKKIFLLNPVPEGMLKDEIEGMAPIIINGDLTKVL
jgi:nucleoside 2-deoxyribosyltransferase